MNTRVLELVKNHNLLREEDLEILEKEIYSKPYLQNVRALYLLGTYKFDKENYQKVLSATAAYTTDKKILYQLINGKSEEKNIPSDDGQPEYAAETIEETSPEPQINVPILDNAILDKENQENQENLEKNELKTGNIGQNNNDEEKFFPESHSNQEENIEKLQEEKKADFGAAVTDNTQAGTPEILIEAESITSEKDVIEDAEILSFQAMQEFLPEVKIKANAEKNMNTPSINSKENRHREEMRKLIEEVERKMKEKKESKTEKSIEEDLTSSEISFAETMDFTGTSGDKQDEIPKQKSPETEKNDKIKPKQTLATHEEKTTPWKPMSIPAANPDSFTTTNNTSEKEEAVSVTLENEENKELPIMNVSFFSEEIFRIKEQQENEKPETLEAQQSSNVPQFINTWQSWLKIDRKEEQKEEAPEKKEIKEKAIEKFIETEPKISQLKQEANFVIKEKKDDISHLMTETLAKLYIEQRLWAKAIRAYEILTEKYPEKTNYFSEKIEEIKDLRSNVQ